MKTNTRSFLEGLMYGLAFANTIVDKNDFDFNSRSSLIILWLNDGRGLTIGINRDISHVYGNLSCMLTGEYDHNLFDINWLYVDQKSILIDNGFVYEYSDLRVGFDDLVKIVELLGGVDVVKSKSEWLKTALRNKYITD